MINHPFAGKTKSPNPASAFKITPSNSPRARSPSRSPAKNSLPSTELCLQQVIGTTTTSPNGFAYHSPSRAVALCAGSAAVFTQYDGDFKIHQKFYRATPTAIAINDGNPSHGTSTFSSTPERRRHSIMPTRATITSIASPGSPSKEMHEHDAFKTWTSRKRVKAVSCVAINPDGRYLAVGEDAHNSLPLSITTEHSYGVRSVAFSSDSRYLASLGDVNDGFIFVYSFNRKDGVLKMVSSSKCTAWVRDMVWFGSGLITVGTRHVKVWRPPERQAQSPTKSARPRLEAEVPPSPGVKHLSGRNVILGKLADSIFTCVVAISQSEAVLCTESGAICLLDDSDGRQELRLVKNFDFSIYAASVSITEDKIWLGGSNLHLVEESLRNLRSCTASPSKLRHGSRSSSVATNSTDGQASAAQLHDAIIGLGELGTKLIYLDNQKSLRLRSADEFDGNAQDDAPLSTVIKAHSEPIEGVRLMHDINAGIGFFTWSREGQVCFWDFDGSIQKSAYVPVEQAPMSNEDLSNELKCLQASPSDKFLISGDLLGVVSLELLCPVHVVRAHGAEVTDIAVHGNDEQFLIATSSRDRIVQLFEKTPESLDLIQSLDDHVGSVGAVKFANKGDRLISASSDRTVVIRHRLTKDDSDSVFSMQRVISLKASPVAMALHPDEDTLIVSTMDRYVLRLEMSTGAQSYSFKTADSDDNESVILSKLALSPSPANDKMIQAIVGMSSTDKSIRVYDYDRGTLLASEFGHTEGVTDVLLKTENRDGETNRRLISTGLDCLIMIWSLSFPDPRQAQEWSQPSYSTPEPDKTHKRESVASRTPLRRLLSKSDLSDYTRLDPVTGTPVTPTRESSPPRLRKRPSNFSIHTQDLPKSRVTTSGSPTASTSLAPPSAGHPLRSTTTNRESRLLSTSGSNDSSRELQSGNSRANSPVRSTQFSPTTAHPPYPTTISEQTSSSTSPSTPRHPDPHQKTPPHDHRRPSRSTSISSANTRPITPTQLAATLTSPHNLHQTQAAHRRTSESQPSTPPIKAGTSTSASPSSDHTHPNQSQQTHSNSIHDTHPDPSQPADREFNEIFELKSINEASEQTIRILKAYRHKLLNTQEADTEGHDELDASILEEVRRELNWTSEAVRASIEPEKGRGRQGLEGSTV
ncbi:MAG: hypothetical protein Q9227_004866 [Pyrenula ochraceoflavens]